MYQGLEYTKSLYLLVTYMSSFVYSIKIFVWPIRFFRLICKKNINIKVGSWHIGSTKLFKVWIKYLLLDGEVCFCFIHACMKRMLSWFSKSLSKSLYIGRLSMLVFHACMKRLLPWLSKSLSKSLYIWQWSMLVFHACIHETHAAMIVKKSIYRLTKDSWQLHNFNCATACMAIKDFQLHK